MDKKDKNNKIQYLRRSYFATDGLWFLMMEKYLSPEKAFAVDKEVWEILPKIQAREAKKLLGINRNTTTNLFKALKLKLEAEGYNFHQKIENDPPILVIQSCPWYEIVKKSKREHLSIDVICKIDFQTWVNEFSLPLRVKIDSALCRGSSYCQLLFLKE